MTNATLITAPDTTTSTTATGRPVLRATLVSGVAAAVAVTAVAAVADAAGVPFAIDGETIPLAGFAQMTLIGAVLGGLFAWAFNRFSSHARRNFVTVTAVLTALSCVPSAMLPPDTATKVILVATHVLAAAIIVPVIARQTTR